MLKFMGTIFIVQTLQMHMHMQGINIKYNAISKKN